MLRKRIHIIICALLASLLLAYVLKPDEPDMPDEFSKCPNPVQVPSIGVHTFWYCPETHETWKKHWQRWDKPARFELERINRFELQIKRVSI